MEPRFRAPWLALVVIAGVCAAAVALPAGSASAQSDEESSDPTDWTVDPFEGEEDEDDDEDGDGGGVGAGTAGPGVAAELRLDLGYHTRKQMGTRRHPLSVLLGARVVADDTVALELRVPTLWLKRSGPDDEFVVAGPSLAGLWQLELMEGLRAEVGLGFSLPADADNPLQAEALGLAAAIHGLWNLWSYVPDTVGIPIPFRLTYERGPVAVGANVELGVLLAREERREDEDVDDTDAVMQFRYWLAYQLDALQIGLRFQHVVGLTRGVLFGGDKHQATILPFVESDLGHDLFLGGGLLVNIDAPAGFVDGPSRDVWALRAWAGVRL